MQKFLSTPSARRATPELILQTRAPGISIHALREEGDLMAPDWALSAAAISIHALREEGDVEPLTAGVMPLLFLSTPSARRATRLRPR